MLLERVTFLENAIEIAGEEILEEIELILQDGDSKKSAEAISRIVRDLISTAKNKGLYVNEEEGEKIITPTRKKFELAIVGEGFFALEGPYESTFYTRDGRFLESDDGYLMSINGYYVLGFSPDGTLSRIKKKGDNWMILDGGIVQAYFEKDGSMQKICDVVIAKFPKPFGLSRHAGSYYVPTANSGTPSLQVFDKEHLKVQSLETLEYLKPKST